MKPSALLIFLVIANIASEVIFDENPILCFYPCLGADIVYEYKYGLPMGEETDATLIIPSGDRPFKRNTTIYLEYIAGVNPDLVIKGLDKGTGRETQATFDIFFKRAFYKLPYAVKGINNAVSYMSEVKINGKEYCEKHLVGYLDKIVFYYTIARKVRSSVPDKHCGRRKVNISKPRSSGVYSQPGSWPWHAIIYRNDTANNTFICGGTLLSKLFVLTAANCATIDKVPVTPDILEVVLGKHKFGDNTLMQKIKVRNIVVHKKFGSLQPFDNDIALLKLNAEAVYNDYVQPACLWSTKNAQDTSRIKLIGTVLWWSSNAINNISTSIELKQGSLSVVSDQECIKNNSTLIDNQFYKNKFCAQWENGSSPQPPTCNGDIGGGFMVNVPDAKASDIWYVRGIIPKLTEVKSITNTSTCNSEQNVLFTDISKYEHWIRRIMFGKIIARAKSDKDNSYFRT